MSAEGERQQILTLQLIYWFST